MHKYDVKNDSNCNMLFINNDSINKIKWQYVEKIISLRFKRAKSVKRYSNI